MVSQPTDPHAHNEETYDQLMSLIENTQGRLAPIIVACDDMPLRQRLIARYELEARQNQIRPYHLVLGQEPSLRAGLDALLQQEAHLQQGGAAVFTVTGAELLLRVTLTTQEAQSDLDKFFGYLQWTREGLREFRYPIVLWVSYRILQELSRRAPDFWSWRKSVLRFQEESPNAPRVPVVFEPSQRNENRSDAEFLPPLKELQAEIAELTRRDPAAPNLADLYLRLGQVYDQRISQGTAKNLEQARECAIAAFQQSIQRYQAQQNRTGEMIALTRLGLFYKSQSLYAAAIAAHEASLQIAQELGDRDGESVALNNLGNVYVRLGQYQQALKFLQQSFQIKRETDDRNGEGGTLCNLGNVHYLLGHHEQAVEFYQKAVDVQRAVNNRDFEANSLTGLGNVYHSLKQYERAIEFHQQSLQIKREIDDRGGEANSLFNLGNAYAALDRYQRAVEFYQKSLQISHKIGDRYGKSASLFELAKTLAKLGDSWAALQHYQQAKQTYSALGLQDEVEKCENAIYALNQTIPVQQSMQVPRIENQPSSQRSSSRKRRQAPRGFGF